MPTGGTICTPDNGIVFLDQSNHCFVRANPTYSVRERGALCAPVRLAPQTLYFLAVGRSAATSLEGARNGVGALNASLVGAAGYTSNSTQITAPWSFVVHGLPPTFGYGTTITSGSGSGLFNANDFVIELGLGRSKKGIPLTNLV
jgi:hypothetical protein